MLVRRWQPSYNDQKICLHLLPESLIVIHITMQCDMPQWCYYWNSSFWGWSIISFRKLAAHLLLLARFSFLLLLLQWRCDKHWTISPTELNSHSNHNNLFHRNDDNPLILPLIFVHTSTFDVTAAINNRFTSSTQSRVTRLYEISK